MLLLTAGPQPVALLPARCPVQPWRAGNRGKDTPKSRWEAVAVTSIKGGQPGGADPYRASLIAAVAAYKEEHESLSR